MKKFLSGVGVVLAAVGLFSAGAWAKEGGKTIQFWHAMTGENEAVLKDIAAKFNAQDEYNVELVFQGHYRDLFAKLEGAAKANNMPALAMIYNNRLVSYVLNGFAQPLDDMMADPKNGFTKEELADIPEFLRESSVWDGKHYALPFNKGTFLLLYNKKMLADKHIAVPTTWAELEAAAKALTDPEHKVYGLAFNQSVMIDGSQWIEQAGGHVYDEANDKITFNEESGVKAYEFLVGLIRIGYARIAREEKYITGPFGRGEAAMGITQMSQLPNINEACKAGGIEYGAAPLPKDVRSASLFSGTNVAIFNTCPEADRQAAFRFLKFFLKPENQWEWGTRSGYLPLSWQILKSDKFKAFAEKEDPGKLAALPAFENGFIDPRIVNGYAIHDNMSKALDAILLENKPIKQALDDAAAQAWKEILEARKAF